MDGLGLFWAMDIQKNRDGDFIGEVEQPMHPAVAAFKAALNKHGMFTMMRGHTVFADVVGEDMPVVERIVAQPATTGTGSIPITNLVTPVKISLERLKSGPLFG